MREIDKNGHKSKGEEKVKGGERKRERLDQNQPHRKRAKNGQQNRGDGRRRRRIGGARK